MALRPFPMTLGDLEGHSPVAGLIKCNLTNMRHFARFQLTLRVVPRQELSF